MLMHNVIPRLSGTPGKLRHPAPTLGQHTSEVLRRDRLLRRPHNRAGGGRRGESRLTVIASDRRAVLALAKTWMPDMTA